MKFLKISSDRLNGRFLISQNTTLDEIPNNPFMIRAIFCEENIFMMEYRAISLSYRIFMLN